MIFAWLFDRWWLDGQLFLLMYKYFDNHIFISDFLQNTIPLNKTDI